LPAIEISRRRLVPCQALDDLAPGPDDRELAVTDTKRRRKSALLYVWW
jgi:hypothetical protein